MRKLFIKLIALSGITLLTPGLSYAQWYVGVGVGQTNIETEFSDYSDTTFSETLVIDDNDKSWKIFGGWKPTPSFALEFGYTDLGKYSTDYSEPGFNSNDSLEATAFFLEGVGSIDLGSGFRFLGKLGFAYWDGTVDTSNNTPFSNSGSDNGLDPVLGLGFEYKFPRMPLGLRLEWEQYQNVWEDVSFKRANTYTETLNGLDINTFGLALTYEFKGSH